MDNESKPVNESLIILEESEEWDDYLASEEAFESELKEK